MNYENKRKEEIIRATQLWECGDITRENLEYIFPELQESEDERIRQKFIKLIKMSSEVGGFALHKWEADEMLAWLEKQGESNPYSGVSFEYNGNIWGMCARDNGVDILLNKELIRHVSIVKQGEKKSVDKVEQKNKWNEEDEEILMHIIQDVVLLLSDEDERFEDERRQSLVWLKSLKQRMEEWL